MDGSRVVAWTTLAGALISAGMLFRSRFRPEFDDPHEQVIYDMSTAIALSAMLGSLPRLFHIENIVLQVAADAVSIVVAIFVFVQLRQLVRMNADS